MNAVWTSRIPQTATSANIKEIFNAIFDVRGAGTIVIDKI